MNTAAILKLLSQGADLHTIFKLVLDRLEALEAKQNEATADKLKIVRPVAPGTPEE